LFDDRVLSEIAFGYECGSGDDRAFVKTFRYAFDPLCLSACWLYAVNRWLIEPVCAWPFLHEHFNDLFLIPAALPLVLGLQREVGLRWHDRPPTIPEIVGHLFIWSLISELLGPFASARSVGDPLDVLAYAAGALVAGIWWNRQSLLSRVAGSSKPSVAESRIQLTDK
jgi:hypothetical protein